MFRRGPRGARIRARSAPSRTGDGRKYGSTWAYYWRGRLHSACAPHDDERCLFHAAKGCSATCAICVERKSQPERWYQSKDEAKRAALLDREKERGDILDWERGPKLELVPAVVGQKNITYTPDFKVTHRDGSVEMQEVKGSWLMIADDAHLKMKMYRVAAAEHGWPPLRVVNSLGRDLPRPKARRVARAR